MNVEVGTEAACALSRKGIHKWDFRCGAVVWKVKGKASHIKKINLLNCKTC
jgi:hypothetical protein